MTGRTLAQGLNTSFTIGERIDGVRTSGSATDDDEGISAVTDLGFSISSETLTQRLEFSGSGNIPLFLDTDDDRSTFSLDDPSLSLSYKRENSSTLLSLDTSYRESDLGVSNFFDEALDQDVATGGGTRTLLSLRAGLTLGRDAPVTATFNYRFLDSTFSDADPSLDDSETQSFDGRLNLELSPVASVFVFGEAQVEDSASDADTTTSSVGAGLEYSLSSVTDMTVQVSYDRNETEGGLNDQSQNGLGFDITWLRAVPNGTYRLNASTRETIDGTRNSATLGRALDFQRSSLDMSFGLSKTGGQDVEPMVNFELSYALTPTSDLSASLSQTAAIDQNAQSTVRTRLNVNYTHLPNEFSSLVASLLLASDDSSGATNDSSRTTQVSLQYNYALVREWDLVTSITLEHEDTTDDSTTRTISIGLERTFNFRP